MLEKVTIIEQPYSGEYKERIYDIKGSSNSSDWTWVKFEEDNDYSWCGEFRGKSIGVAFSKKLGIIVILTSEYMYILDLKSKELIEYKKSSEYTGITCTPLEDIILSSLYGLDFFKGKTISSIDTIVLPVHTKNIKFLEYDGKILRITGTDAENESHQVKFVFDCENLSIKEELSKK